MCKISIIIPVYNSEAYLRQCLDSLTAQTFSDFEALCINDGSTDGSEAILRQYEAQDPRFRLISQPNAGASQARNAGLDRANGEYVMFLDADDWYETDTCHAAYEAITAEKADAALFSGIWEYAGQSVVNHALGEERLVLDDMGCQELRRKMFGLVGEELGQIMKFDYLALLYLKIYRRDIILEHRLAIPDIRETGSFEDGLFNIRYFQFVHRAVYTGLPLYHYRKDNAASITTRYKPDFIRQWRVLFDRMQKEIDSENLGEAYQHALNNRIAYSILGVGCNLMNSGEPARTKIQAIKRYISQPQYKSCAGALETESLPWVWKAFFWAAKHRSGIMLYWLLLAIQKIRASRNAAGKKNEKKPEASA